jgi:hypothetical protein
MLKTIAKLVSEYSGFTLTEIKSPSRKGELPNARKVFTYFAKTYTNATYAEVNQYLGYNDKISSNLNTAIDYNFNVVLDWLSINQYIPGYFYTVETLIKKQLYSPIPVQSNVEICLIKDINYLLQSRFNKRKTAKTIPIEDLLKIIKKYE